MRKTVALAVGLGIVMGAPLGAHAQTSCTVQTQSQLLSAFSDSVPAGSITPQTMRDFVCSTLLAVPPLPLVPYTVATLPTSNATTKGDMVYVTDATSPTYGGTLTGGGTTVTPAFCIGAAWTAH